MAKQVTSRAYADLRRSKALDSRGMGVPTGQLVAAMCLFTVFFACSGAPQDESISRSVKTNLINYREANLQRVEAFVDQGVVYLDGEVEDIEQKHSAARIARETPGVSGVVNKLHVVP